MSFSQAVDARWASWGSWGGCSKTCGGGVRTFRPLLNIRQFLFRDSQDLEDAMWLKMVEALQSAQALREHQDCATPTNVVSVLMFTTTTFSFYILHFCILDVDT